MGSSIIAIMTVIATLVGALIGVIVPVIIKSYKDKRAYRVTPNVSIWSNKHDDINSRLRNGQATRWFIELEKLQMYFYSCLYVVICAKNNYNMYRCHVDITIKNQNAQDANPIPYNIGTLDSQDRVAIPIVYTRNSNCVECAITYFTEKHEKMKYHISFFINHELSQAFGRKDETFLLHEHRNKNKSDNERRIEFIDVSESESYTSNDIVKKLGPNETLNYHIQGDINDGNNN